MSRRIVVIGATSSIARGAAEAFARRGDRLALAGRDTEEVERLAADLRVRTGVEAHAVPFDASDPASHARVIDECADRLGGPIDGVVVCHGFMAAQADASRDPSLVGRMVEANYTSFVTVLNAAAERVRAPGGFLCAVSSVAGDRGRPSNFIYGSTKAALDAYLEGLRAAQFKRGVTVTAVKPGFVDTAMTWGLPGMFLVASPAAVGKAIERAATRGKAVAYTPWFWRWIMMIIRWIPRPVFNRMKM